MVLLTLWWLLFWSVLGLGVGSFLNAVIYRLPRDQSLRSPVWSACPWCRHRIRWYDNVPVVSFVLLGGRCRDCSVPIATRYPVVELTMAMIVIVLVDAFCIGQTRSHSPMDLFALTECLTRNWPILVAHIVLFACLLSMSAIDLEHYWVDIRFTNLATLAGFALHAIWTPTESATWYQPSDTTAIVALFAVVGLGLVWVLSVCRPHVDPEDFGETGEEEFPEETPPVADEGAPPSVAPSRLPAWIIGIVFVAVLSAAAYSEATELSLPHVPRALVPLLLLFALIVRESAVSRASDHQIIEEIEAERYSARKMVSAELCLLLPPILLGGCALWLLSSGGDLPDRMTSALHTEIRVPSVPCMYRWQPLYGLATAAAGYLLAGALGWFIRILFTLAFGKEAFGVGDIHMMAAAGCVAGWPVVALGFMLTCGLAIVGWVCTLPFKRSRAIPLGPWLSLGFLTVAVFYKTIIEWTPIARVIEAVRYLWTDPFIFGAGL